MGEILEADSISAVNQPLFFKIYDASKLPSLTGNFGTLCRRAMTTMLRGGIPIALIEKINECMGTLGISAAGYETVGINFSDGVQSLCQENIAELLEYPIFYLKNQILKGSNESTWRALFWDPVVMKLFRSDTGLPEPVDFIVSTTALFPCFTVNGGVVFPF